MKQLRISVSWNRLTHLMLSIYIVFTTFIRGIKIQMLVNFDCYVASVLMILCTTARGSSSCYINSVCLSVCLPVRPSRWWTVATPFDRLLQSWCHWKAPIFYCFKEIKRFAVSRDLNPIYLSRFFKYYSYFKKTVGDIELLILLHWTAIRKVGMGFLTTPK